MGRGVQRFACAMAATVAGCATMPPCPARGGPAWHELTGEHFVLRSDLPLDKAMDVLRTLEETRAAMLAGIWPGAAGPQGLTPAIALSSGELSAFAGPHFDGFHLRRPPFPPTLVLGDSDSSQSTAKHELAHDLASYFLPVQPPWYAEGLATFLETIRYDREHGRAVIGAPNETRFRYFQHGRPMPPDKLLGPMPDDPFERSQFYATSWLLMHYICNQRPDGWQGLQHRLGRLQPGAQAFREEFPDLDGEGLDRKLMDYAARGNYVFMQTNVAPWLGTPRVRTMTDSEVHGVRAFLYWSLRDRNEDTTDTVIRAEVNEALRSDPPSLEALAVSFYGLDAQRPEYRIQLAALAIRAHPQDWMTWLMSADLPARSPGQRRSDLARGLRLSPMEPELLIQLAGIHARERLWDDVLALTNRVLDAGPTHPQLWSLHLTALRATGHCRASERWGTTLQGYLPPADASHIAALLAAPCPAPSATEAAAAN